STRGRGARPEVPSGSPASAWRQLYPAEGWGARLPSDRNARPGRMTLKGARAASDLLSAPRYRLERSAYGLHDIASNIAQHSATFHVLRLVGLEILESGFLRQSLLGAGFPLRRHRPSRVH